MTHKTFCFELITHKIISNDKLKLISYFKLSTKHAENAFNKNTFFSTEASDGELPIEPYLEERAQKQNHKRQSRDPDE